MVVDAVLLVGKPYPPVFLGRTVNPDAPFSRENLAETGATVTIRGYFGTEDDEPSFEITYVEHDSLAGVYIPDLPFQSVAPGVYHELEVITTREEIVSASTTTPPPFKVREWVLLNSDGQSVNHKLITYEEVASGVYTAPENQLRYATGILEARFERPDVLSFQVGVFSLDSEAGFVVDPDFFDDEDFADLDRVSSSPPFDAIDGTLRLPWFVIYYEGRHKVYIHAVERNWYDLIRSSPSLIGGVGGFGGTAGDDFERPIFHVNGGIGLFGAATPDSIGFYVHPGE